jgi:acyl carrier protein
MTASSASIATASFPAATVEADLRRELTQCVRDEARAKGIALPATVAAVVAAPFQIDSLAVVEILCAVEPVLGFELPDSVVLSGGYGSVDAAIAELMPRIRAQWEKRKGGKP